MRLPPWLKKEGLFLPGCVLLAVLIRLALLAHEYVISPDGVEYAWLGRHMVSGNFQRGLNTYFPPLYPLLVGLSSLVFHDLEFAGRFVSVLAGGLLVIPVFQLAKNFYDKGVAALAACIVVVFPVLTYYSAQLLTESVYTLFFTTGVLIGWGALARFRPLPFFQAGIVFAACYLVRPEAFAFVFLLAALALLAGRFHVAGTFRRTSLNVAALVAGFLLLASPYLIYLRQQTGRWTVSEKMGSHLLLIDRAEESPSLPPDQAAQEKPVAEMAETPSPPDVDEESALTRFIVKATKSLRAEYEIINLTFPPLCVLLTGIGLFRVRWTRERLGRELYLASFIISALMGYALTVMDIRYLVPLLPLLLCWVANGIMEFDKWLAETIVQVRGQRSARRAQRWMVRAMLASLSVILLLPLFVYLNRGDKWEDYLGQKRAGQWIKAHSATPPVVMAENPVTSFYAGGDYVVLPNADYGEVIATARRERVGFVVVYARYLKNTRLSFMLDGQNVPPEIKLVYRHGDGTYKVVVYQLTGEQPSTSLNAPL